MTQSHFYTSSVMKLTLAMALGLGMGVTLKRVLAPYASDWQLTASASNASSPTETVQLDATVLVDDTVIDAEHSRIALPSGTRFKLQIACNRGGLVEVHAISPDGRGNAEPLWTARMQAGQSVVTPVLRLQGARGLETLQVVLVGPLQHVQAQRDIQIWHL